MALIKCQNMWLKYLDYGAKYVRVLSFDLSKTFDNVPHDVLFEKVKKLPLSPYVINWLMNFLQRSRAESNSRWYYDQILEHQPWRATRHCS